MSVVVVLLTALAAGAAALALGPWMRRVARVRSHWLSSGAHVLLAGALGAGAALLARSWPELVAFAVLALACALLAVIDLATYRLPDVIVGPTYLVFFSALALTAAVDGDWGRLGRAAAGAGVVLVGYFVLAFVSPSGLGLGDVKFSGVLGGFLGWFGWQQVLLGTLAAFVLSACVAGTLLVTRRADRRTEFPFGPWMVAGAGIGALWVPGVLG
ncbi:prepilin peptidase [Georgenia yuyongxinii]|uniref:Prepilin peptidase n=1 Tax=Georgenia yuyongxinii TaxID=2589797 RepID=A0A5B8C0C1_9MICO|nr:A24 family peptidase [Georgenia yuyongxinii]QDC24149.1 prepilin peptidase [Georgenia yuyongxinii]